MTLRAIMCKISGTTWKKNKEANCFRL